MYVAPSDNGLILVIASTIFLALSWITVTTRAAVRVHIKAFWVDDWLMAAGLILFTGTCFASIMMAIHGGGARVVHYAPHSVREDKKWLFVTQFLFVTSTAPIRISICVSLLRITSQKWHRIALYLIIACVGISMLVTDIGIFAQASPIKSFWTPDTGNTRPPGMIIGVSFFISVMSILEDLAIAAIPWAILRHVQLAPQVKLSLMVVLALGSTACLPTIVRFKYLFGYNEPESLYELAALVTCCVVEMGIALVAGSIPALRPLFRSLRRDVKSQQSDIEMRVPVKRRGSSQSLTTRRSMSSGQVASGVE